MDDELQDWVVLHHHHHHHPHPNSDSDSVPLDEIDSAGTFLHADYFSLDSLKRYAPDLDDNKSAVSDNPSWIDPGFEDNPARYLHKESTEFWSDSSSDRSEDRNKFTDFLVRNQMDFYKGIRDGKGDSTAIEATSSGKSEEEEDEDTAKVQEQAENDQGNEEHHMRDDEIDKKSSHVVWWKLPMEFVKYFVFRMSPVWTVSVAAAFMGFVILGRRLYKMKKKNKTRGLQIKVAVDDKVFFFPYFLTTHYHILVVIHFVECQLIITTFVSIELNIYLSPRNLENRIILITRVPKLALQLDLSDSAECGC